MDNYLFIWLATLLLAMLGAICSIVVFRRFSARRQKAQELDSILFTVEKKE